MFTTTRHPMAQAGLIYRFKWPL